ncbi:hypothetical protein ECE50_012365 [Chitinophaga sp. Mgbs1]|uniref:Uncharacterized protein n=1 Tax=Chitinophaga solisilvae TaxID=1233460 RepID=A0A9Q5DAI0_9BACT|nr:hypothetical protein [Chitinophaga solisilvae]
MKTSETNQINWSAVIAYLESGGQGVTLTPEEQEIAAVFAACRDNPFLSDSLCIPTEDDLRRLKSRTGQ